MQNLEYFGKYPGIPYLGQNQLKRGLLMWYTSSFLISPVKNVGTNQYLAKTLPLKSQMFWEVPRNTLIWPKSVEKGVIDVKYIYFPYLTGSKCWYQSVSRISSPLGPLPCFNSSKRKTKAHKANDASSWWWNDCTMTRLLESLFLQKRDGRTDGQTLL